MRDPPTEPKPQRGGTGAGLSLWCRRWRTPCTDRGSRPLPEEEGDQTPDEAAGPTPSGCPGPSFLRRFLRALALRPSRVPQAVGHRPTEAAVTPLFRPSLLVSGVPSIPQPWPEILHVVRGPGPPAADSESVW